MPYNHQGENIGRVHLKLIDLRGVLLVKYLSVLDITDLMIRWDESQDMIKRAEMRYFVDKQPHLRIIELKYLFKMCVKCNLVLWKTCTLLTHFPQKDCK